MGRRSRGWNPKSADELTAFMQSHVAPNHSYYLSLLFYLLLKINTYKSVINFILVQNDVLIKLYIQCLRSVKIQSIYISI